MSVAMKEINCLPMKEINCLPNHYDSGENSFAVIAILTTYVWFINRVDT